MDEKKLREWFKARQRTAALYAEYTKSRKEEWALRRELKATLLDEDTFDVQEVKIPGGYIAQFRMPLPTSWDNKKIEKVQNYMDKYRLPKLLINTHYKIGPKTFLSLKSTHRVALLKYTQKSRFDRLPTIVSFNGETNETDED